MSIDTQAIKPIIYINGRFFSQRITGIQRYARETLLALDKIISDEPNQNFKLTLLTPQNVDVPLLNAIKVEACGSFHGHLWEQFDLPKRVGKGMLFSFGPTGPIIKKNQIITIHDLAVFRIPNAFSRLFRAWYKFIYLVIASRTNCIITVSRFSADELNHCLNVPLDKIRISTEGWQHLALIEDDAMVLKKFNLENKDFVLAVSSPTPNKNFATIVQAFKLLGSAAPLGVAAGKADEKVFKEVGVAMEVIQALGYVSDAELKGLYKNATCFIFPSFYEGFGIPPLEAMSCGCPIIAADIPSVREVCGESALYFDPHQPEALALLIQEIIAKPSLQKSLSESGLARANQFSWSKSAKINLDVMNEVVRHEQC